MSLMLIQGSSLVHARYLYSNCLDRADLRLLDPKTVRFLIPKIVRIMDIYRLLWVTKENLDLLKKIMWWKFLWEKMAKWWLKMAKLFINQQKQLNKEDNLLKESLLIKIRKLCVQNQWITKSLMLPKI